MTQSEHRSAEARFLECLDSIDRIVASLCRRHGLRGDDADDFASLAKLHLIEDDYAVVRKFRGESSISTYLAVVLAMLLREYRVQRWGRWRPSAEARRKGDLAVRLETLVYRDRLRFAEAAEVLRSSGETAQSDRELGEMLTSLPRRTPIRPMEVGPDLLDGAEGTFAADDIVERESATYEQDSAKAALDGAMSRLAPEDLLIVRLRFWEEMTIAEVARALKIEQKPLYRRIERVLGELRASLLASGLSREQAELVLREPV